MTELIGRFHPLLVHIPIGILVLALLISFLPGTRRASMQPAFSLALAVSAISSALACVAGYLLANSGDYEGNIVQNHQWAGIATCVLSFTAWLAPRFNRQLLWATAAVLVVASHLGGTLTHGEGYLLNGEEEIPMAIDSVVTSQDSIAFTVSDTSTGKPVVMKVNMYKDEISPLLKSRCYNCHSAVKKKGGLRLDSEAFISKGGKNGEVVVNGNPDKSTLYTHLLLPLDDDKHMPPKGKKQLSRQEIDLIHRWIKKGAPFGAIDVMPFAQTEAPAEQAAIKAGEAGQPAEADPSATNIADITKRKQASAPPIPPADEQVIRSMQEQGIIIEKIDGGSNGVAMNFVNVKDLDGSMLSGLAALSQQVTSLKFTGQPVTDQMLKSIASLPNLEKLQLEKTNITDDCLEALKNFPRLETINLYGTRVSDQGLSKLNNRELKKINLWNTNVSQQGIDNLISKYPGLEVEAGQLSLKKPDSTKKRS